MKNLLIEFKNYSEKINFPLIYILLLAVIIFPLITAEAKVMVTPTRVVFEEGQRSAVIRLVNPEDSNATYRVSFFNNLMTEAGIFETIITPDSREERLDNYLAEDLIRYSPRQVTLPPGEIQLVRLQLVKPGDLKEGEYRSRLLFQEIPLQEETTFAAEVEADSPVSNIFLQAIYGVSIPVIVRHGESSAAVEISDLYLDKESENPQLSFQINRSGNASVFGDFEVQYILEEEDKAVFRKNLGRVRGIAVYPEIEKRYFTIVLNAAETLDLEKGRLNVIYRSTAEEGGRILAQTTLEL